MSLIKLAQILFDRAGINNTILLILVAVVISGCGNKQVYDNVQQNAQHECRKLPPAAYQECIDQYSESFESYTQKREELLNEL